MEKSLKFLLLAGACLLAILLISISFIISNKGRDGVDKGLETYGTITDGNADIDLKIYDGREVDGVEVKRFIKSRVGDEYLSVVVKTKGGESIAYINKCTIPGLTINQNTGADYSAIPTKKTDLDYINDSGQFLGTCYTNENNVITCVWFEQQ